MKVVIEGKSGSGKTILLDKIEELLREDKNYTIDDRDDDVHTLFVTILN